uniref:BTB domain-containing protein n=1 Tax=Panagrellus redivivus TaxID=6233 RepID=A0A7E4VV96_PANRE
MSHPDVSAEPESPVPMEVDEHVESTIIQRHSLTKEQIQKLLRCDRRESCQHRHSTGLDGVHLAEQDGQNFVFPRPDSAIVCAEGHRIKLNRLHAIALSSYFGVCFLHAAYPKDHNKDEVHLPFFNAVEIVDAFELTNLVIQRMHFDKIPLSAASLPPMQIACAFRVLNVAAYLDIKYLLEPISDYIDKNITPEHLVEGYKISKVTCADLAMRLWRRILDGFMLLYDNRTFLQLEKKDIDRLIKDPTLNVLWAFDDILVRVYDNYHTQKKIQQAFRNRVQQAVTMVSSAENVKSEASHENPKKVRPDIKNFMYKRVAKGALPEPVRKMTDLPKPRTRQSTTTIPPPTSSAPKVPPPSTSTATGATNGIGLSRLPRAIVLCTGGWGDNGPTDRVEVYDYHREQWNPPAHPSVVETVRAYHGLHVNDYGILCMGGFNGRQNFRSASLFNFESMSWKYICASVDIRCYVSIGTLDKDHIIACGGYTGQMRLRSTEIYSFTENEWQRVGPMNIVRSDARAVTLGTAANGTCKVFMIGGFDGRQCHKSLEYYDPVRDEWIAERNSMNTKRSGVGAVGIGENVIIAMGGFNGAVRLSTTELYDVREGIWHELGSLNTSRSNFGSCCLAEEPWVFGGYNNERTISECERFDSRMNRWVTTPSMNGSRSALASIAVEHPDFIRQVVQRGSNVPLSVVWDESVSAFVPTTVPDTVSS